MAQSKSDTHMISVAWRELESLRLAHSQITLERVRMLASARDAHTLALHLVELITQEQQAGQRSWLLSAMLKKAVRLRDLLAKELDDDNRTDDRDSGR